MKINKNLLYISLIFTLSVSFTIAETQIDKFDDIESLDIDALFKSDSTKVDQKNLDPEEEIKKENLDLDNLEIEDIDIETYGKYEEFLNQYYNENFLDLNKPNIKSKTIFVTTILGGTVPAGAGIRYKHATGGHIAFSMSTPINFHISKFVLNLAPELGISTMSAKDDTVKPYYLYNVIGFLWTDITKKWAVGVGPSLHFASSGKWNSSNSGLAFSIYVDVLYKFAYKKFNMGVGLRAQDMLLGVLDPPLDGCADIHCTAEILGLYLNLNMPITFRY